jgi:hypothetical protein
MTQESTSHDESCPKQQKPPSPTARALAMVEAGLTIKQASNICGITPQSVYRLQKYRAGLHRCITCGALMKKNPAA